MRSKTPDTSRAGRTRKRTRIQEEREGIILDAALEVFSTFGFRGATVDQVAERAGMTKPNLLYYFRRKRDLYLAVLQRTLDEWLEPLRAIDPGGDPQREIVAYVDRKLAMSRDKPEASRLFALEMLQGAPVLGTVLSGELKDLVDEKAAVIRQWSDEGRLAAVDPRHLIFMVWATTQHYADFSIQIGALLGHSIDHQDTFEDARATLTAIFTRGLQTGSEA